MYRAELEKLEGVWIGTEQVLDAGEPYEASGRLTFQAIFDGRFLLCDYVQTAPDHATSMGHGVFRRDERTQALTVTWFRSPVVSPAQQEHAVAEGDKLVFDEMRDGRASRTTYTVKMDHLSVRTECSIRGGEWKQIFEGSYRRRR